MIHHPSLKSYKIPKVWKFSGCVLFHWICEEIGMCLVCACVKCVFSQLFVALPCLQWRYELQVQLLLNWRLYTRHTSYVNILWFNVITLLPKQTDIIQHQKRKTLAYGETFEMVVLCWQKNWWIRKLDEMTLLSVINAPFMYLLYVILLSDSLQLCILFADGDPSKTTLPRLLRKNCWGLKN